LNRQWLLWVVSTQSIFGKLPFKCEIFVAAYGALATPASGVLPTDVMKVSNVRPTVSRQLVGWVINPAYQTKAARPPRSEWPLADNCKGGFGLFAATCARMGNDSFRSVAVAHTGAVVQFGQGCKCLATFIRI